MKRPAIISALLFTYFVATATSFGQQGCEFNIIGTWKAAGETQELLYRFGPDGTVTVLSTSGSRQVSEPREIARATFEIDDPKAPKSIAITATTKSPVFLLGKNSMNIIEYTETSLTCELPGYERTRWTRVDPNQYFIVLTARRGEFYDTSGPAFPMLIKIVGRESQIDAVGTYSDRGKEAFGRVPGLAYKDFLRESRTDSEVILRLEINTAQYERGLKILRSWERRVREDALLYPFNSSLNNVLLVKAVTETLNQCTEEFKLYKLNYLSEDWIAEQYSPQFIPFIYFKELRRLNESRHLSYDKLPQVSRPAGSPVER